MLSVLGNAERSASGAPGRRAAVVCGGVVTASLVVFATVTVLAPMLARSPGRLTAQDLDEDRSGRYVVAEPRLRTGPERDETPSPTSTNRVFVPGPTGSFGTTAPATNPPTARPAQLVAKMGVSATKVKTGDHLIYRVVVSNRGERTYRGAFTVNLHTPAGTARCEPDNDAVCLTPGDYDGSSSDPNDAHINPAGATSSFSLKPGVSKTLYRLEVVVAALEGTVLHNHSHVDGVGRGDGSTTIEPSDVGVSGFPVSRAPVSAPDVVVEG